LALPLLSGLIPSIVTHQKNLSKCHRHLLHRAKIIIITHTHQHDYLKYVKGVLLSWLAHQHVEI